MSYSERMKSHRNCVRISWSHCFPKMIPGRTSKSQDDFGRRPKPNFMDGASTEQEKRKQAYQNGRNDIKRDIAASAIVGVQ
jgi:hypothetical protein